METLYWCVIGKVLESVQELGDHDPSGHYVDELFDDVEGLSDSDVDMDTISVRSTPKPKLRSDSNHIKICCNFVLSTLLAIRFSIGEPRHGAYIAI